MMIKLFPHQYICTILKSNRFEDAIGVQQPLGFWDPLGLLNDADQERFDRLRNVETKHGRISMLAFLGHLVTTAGYRWPGTFTLDGLKWSDVPAGLHAFDVIPSAGAWQIIFFIGFCDLSFTTTPGYQTSLGNYNLKSYTVSKA